MPCLYHTTSVKETLESHVYIDSYKNVEIKEAMQSYKFKDDKDAMKVFIVKTLDLCIDIQLRAVADTYIYTSPPSTMHARGEKKVDSMFELLKSALLVMPQYVSGKAGVLRKVFSISHTYLNHKKAQHIGGTRKSRTSDMDTRYGIRFAFKLYLWFCIHILKRTRFSFIIIDDVSSTGGTLISCRNTLSRYLSIVQRKNVGISFDIQVFSLAH